MHCERIGLVTSLLIGLTALLLTGWQEARIRIMVQRIEELQEAINKIDIKDRQRRETPVQYTTGNPISELTKFKSDDGIPILSQKYKDAKGREDIQGFKVYSAWFNHKREKDIEDDPRVVWSHPTDSPVRAYHRKSAAWSGSEASEDRFQRFGSSLYHDGSQSETKRTIKSNSHTNSINYSSNRAKITNKKEFQEHRVTETESTTTPATTTSQRTRNETLHRDLNEHIRNKVTLRAARNRAALRSASRRFRARNSELTRTGRRAGMKGLLAVHLQAEQPTDSVESRVRQTDGIIREWTFSRWARRMNLGERFGLVDGVLTVPSPGVYYLYAQVNYLDEHDVNAFQIYVNQSPFIMCTTMTHTPHFTTKANSCYTGGVVFLEQGDEIYIKNLEENRFSVMLPAHSFFGAIQLSKAGI